MADLKASTSTPTITKTGIFSIPESESRTGTVAGTGIIVTGTTTTFLAVRNPLKGLYIWDITRGIARKISAIHSDTRLDVDKPFALQDFDFTPAIVEVDDIITITMPDSSSIAFTATVATVANVTAGLKALWDAEIGNDFDKFTATDNGTDLQAVSKDFDKFIKNPANDITVTAVDGGGADTQTFVLGINEDGGITDAIAFQVIRPSQYREISVQADGGAIRVDDATTIADGIIDTKREKSGLPPYYGDAGSNNALISLTS